MPAHSSYGASRAKGKNFGDDAGMRTTWAKVRIGRYACARRRASTCGIWIAAQRGPSLTRFNRAWRRRSLTSGAGRPRAASEHGARSAPVSQGARDELWRLSPSSRKEMRAPMEPAFVRLRPLLPGDPCVYAHKASDEPRVCRMKRFAARLCAILGASHSCKVCGTNVRN